MSGLRVDELARLCDLDDVHRLQAVLDDELALGHVVRDRRGRYAIDVDEFDPTTLRALLALGNERSQISVTRLLRRVVRQERSCVVCGEAFTPPRRDGRYCSSACRQGAYRTRRTSIERSPAK
jgi:hypothetical protein